MKTKAVIYLVIFTLLGCSIDSEEFVTESETTTLLNKATSQSSQSAQNTPEPLSYSETELVIKFIPELNADEKQIIRQSHDVIKYETCSCSNEDIEVWHFNPGPNIKSRLGEAEADPDLEGSELQYYITSAPNLFNSNNSSIIKLRKKVKRNDGGVVIAIIDSGVDYNYEGFTMPFLYDTSGEENCSDSPSQQNISGWDFVNDDNDVFDDNGHGTVVTHAIFSKLKDERVPFQILPVKAFDANGKTKYSTIICSYIYAKNTPEVDLINMSFGWYINKLSILNSYIADTQNILVSTSAGNLNLNTDSIPHFPSGYAHDFIITSTGINYNHTGLETTSNFGSVTVDVAATNYHAFPLNTTSQLYQGTSYSAAITTANAAILHTNGVNPMILKNDVIYSGIYSSYLNTINYPYILN